MGGLAGAVIQDHASSICSGWQRRTRKKGDATGCLRACPVLKGGRYGASILPLQPFQKKTNWMNTQVQVLKFPARQFNQRTSEMTLVIDTVVTLRCWATGWILNEPRFWMSRRRNSGRFCGLAKAPIEGPKGARYRIWVGFHFTLLRLLECNTKHSMSLYMVYAWTPKFTIW